MHGMRGARRAVNGAGRSSAASRSMRRPASLRRRRGVRRHAASGARPRRLPRPPRAAPCSVARGGGPTAFAKASSSCFSSRSPCRCRPCRRTGFSVGRLRVNRRENVARKSHVEGFH
ncbi:hypothetical protein BMAA0347 [Burkholderia mallei ATCC 23344]|uniref:Uncharacterized protein n=1 Tax=Burkholderia mallei (strain ATCC 23344) TaxID=243160 RepID=A0A0H2WBS4_BURMA|nr:hypothetical protein BMAA0347 [Burkholderia mallei ATCC 23344]